MERNAASVSAANLAAGMVAWDTTFHALPGGGFGITETRFSNEGLSTAELARISSFCGFIQIDGSGFGICSSCRSGALYEANEFKFEKFEPWLRENAKPLR